MSDIIELKKEYNKFAKKCKDKGFSAYQIFTTPSGCNKELFDELLQIFNKHIEKDLPPFQKTKLFDDLYLEYRQTSTTNGLTTLQYGRSSKYTLPQGEFKENFIDVLYILRELNNVGYIKLEEGILKPIELKANVDTLSDVNKLVGKSKYKLYEGLITPNGDFYVSLNEHTCMCMYMIANGIDIKGSLRITQMPEGNRQFSLSSCNYLSAYSIKGFDDDYNIKITDEQAKSLYKFFKGIKKEGKGGGQTLMQILARSINFGWDFLNVTLEDINISLKHAKYNLQTFQDNMEGEFDGQALYRQVVAYSKQFGKSENEN